MFAGHIWDELSLQPDFGLLIALFPYLLFLVTGLDYVAIWFEI